MKKIISIFVVITMLFSSVVTAYAEENATMIENDMTMEKFIGISDASTISMIYVDIHKCGSCCHVVDESEIKQAYDILMNMPLEKIVDAPTYFEIDKNDGAFPGDVARYKISLCKDGRNLKEFFVTGNKIFTHDWVFVSGSLEEGKENEFYKWLINIEETKQRYENAIEDADLYQNNVFVGYEKLNYKWGKPYINKNNQIMVPFKELNTALNTQATYDVKTQMVSVRKREAVPLYGEVTDEIVYVAARDLAEMGGYDIYWDNELKTVLITDSKSIRIWNKHSIYSPDEAYIKVLRTMPDMHW